MVHWMSKTFKSIIYIWDIYILVYPKIFLNVYMNLLVLSPYRISLMNCHGLFKTKYLIHIYLVMYMMSLWLVGFTERDYLDSH